jgi:hypothetical protein
MERNAELKDGVSQDPSTPASNGIVLRARDVTITAAAGIIASILTLAGIYTTGWFNYASKDEELHVQLVEMAVGILKEPKAAGEAQPRNWAIDVMEKNTDVKMLPEERKLLVDLGGLKTAPVNLSPGGVAFVGVCESGKRIVARFDANSQPTIVHTEPC